MADFMKSPLPELVEYDQTIQALKNGHGPVWMSGCVDAVKALTFNELRGLRKWQLVVTYDEIRARELYEDYLLFDPEVRVFPAKDVMFFHADLQNGYLTRQRMRVIRNMIEEREGVVITTVDALMNLLPPAKVIIDNMRYIEVGQEVNLKDLAKALAQMGYRREALVAEAGQFSIRGDIIDIFTVTRDNPVRIELWGDEVDSIRSFDVESQRSIEQMNDLTIYPATESYVDQKRLDQGISKIRAELKERVEQLRAAFLTEEAARLKRYVEEVLENATEFADRSGLEAFLPYFYEKPCSLLDYFPKDVLICLDEPDRLKAKAEAVWTELEESMKSRLEKGYILSGQSKMLYSPKEIFASIPGENLFVLSNMDYRASYIPALGHKLLRVSSTTRNAQVYKDDFEYLVKDLQRYTSEGWRVVILSASRARGDRQAAMLRDYGLNAIYRESAETIVPQEVCVTYGNLHRGFELPMIRFAVLTEGDLSGNKAKKRKKQTQFKGTKISDFAQLSVGDYVVHENYGLGIYKGIINKKIDDEAKDYITIVYGDGGTLYIPATQFHLIQKYADKDAAKQPKLSKLGTQEWTRTKAKVKGAVQEVAEDLVRLYSKRQGGRGFAFSEDTVWQTEFEELFPYEETTDQLAAIRDTKADMESTKIMDRLICGDVGYGKTEIAIRAAFKAVMDGKQVVFLCPTTILAQQHYNTFSQRMKDFPVRVDLLCRFRSPKEQKKTFEDVAKGQVDIVIGTHRVLSSELKFKDLGLLIIDEEQRFGVNHKEKIKILRENIDVLTMSATPIPRTLHMSMIGVRDMSVLEEAPNERVPIQTYVMEQNPEMVREAINREIARGGQVYYVYNNVKTITEMTAQIAQLVPDANVAYAHGQMSERQLEQVMLDFINGEIDVLVTTTIIETGLDISNVNTIIIHDADRFGLSQLYQLRGRVGRSNRTAYAFIMYRRDKILSEVAEKRLTAIREYTELGSGIRIAMRDLEIRGAGSILGERQHGHIEAVGYDLYCKMLNEAVSALKGESAVTEQFDTTIDLRISAYIPAEYIINESQKLDIYKRITALETDAEISDMQDELIDRFGDIPRCVDNLLAVSQLRTIAHEAYVTQVSGGLNQVRIAMYPQAQVNPMRLMEYLAKNKDRISFQADAQEPVFTIRYPKQMKMDSGKLLESMKTQLNDIKMLID